MDKSSKLVYWKIQSWQNFFFNKGPLCHTFYYGFFFIFSSLETAALTKTSSRILHYFFRILIVSFSESCLLPNLLHANSVILSHKFLIAMLAWYFAVVTSLISSPQCVIKKSNVSTLLASVSIFLTNVKNLSDTRNNTPWLTCFTHDFLYSRKVGCLAWSSFDPQCVTNSNKANLSGKRLIFFQAKQYKPRNVT